LSGGWDYDCAIVGGGPGGLVSALYLRRFQRKVVLVTTGKPRAAWIPRTQNLIGYERGISGPLLLRRLRRQVSRFGMDWYATGAQARRIPGGFELELDEGGRLRARKLILATGMRDVQPELENLAELRQAGLLRYCSICDAYEYRGQPIAVLAADDAGLQKALFLRHWTRDLRLIVPERMTIGSRRMAQLRAARIRVSACRALRAEAARGGRGLWLALDERAPIQVRAAYVELGCTVPDRAFHRIRGIRKAAPGHLVCSSEQRTTVPGLYGVGDCVNVLGQISVAAGQAAVAATAIHNELLSEG
jgi:thioredoxin reductase (NADPH)